MVLSAVMFWSSVVGTFTKGGAVSVAVVEGVSDGLEDDQMKPCIQLGCDHLSSGAST